MVQKVFGLRTKQAEDETLEDDEDFDE